MRTDRASRLMLLLAGALWAQTGQPGPLHAAEPVPQGQPAPQEERPTLGPRTGPGLESEPLTSTTINLKKLRSIHTLYIESIDNSLSDKLVEDLKKSKIFQLASKEKGADAVLRGSCLESRHSRHVHSEVYISDRTGNSVWQDVIYRPYNPPALEQAVSETAALVVAHLERSLRQADTK